MRERATNKGMAAGKPHQEEGREEEGEGKGRGIDERRREAGEEVGDGGNKRDGKKRGE